MNSPSTYVFGQTPTGNIEFGESYHVALTLAAVPNAKVFIENFNDGEDFLTLLGLSDRIACRRPLDRAHLPKTPKIFKDHSSINKVRTELWERIKNRAAEKEWAEELSKTNILQPEISGKSALLWLRNSDYKPERNLTKEGLHKLVKTCKEQQITPIIVGPLPESWSLEFFEILQLGAFYTHPFFEKDSIARQLWFLDYLHDKLNIVANIGMMSGAMDGLAFFAQRQVIFFEFESKSENETRMQKVAEIFEDNFTRITFEPNPFDKFPPDELTKLDNKLEPEVRSKTPH